MCQAVYTGLWIFTYTSFGIQGLVASAFLFAVKIHSFAQSTIILYTCHSFGKSTIILYTCPLTVSASRLLTCLHLSYNSMSALQ